MGIGDRGKREESHSPVPSARIIEEDLTQRTPRRQARKGEERGFYMVVLRFSFEIYITYYNLANNNSSPFSLPLPFASFAPSRLCEINSEKGRE
jgi:hypothetical protein